MTVCLAVMASDEEAVIGRACASARDLVDAWVLLDTGSTDATAGTVRAALEGIPGDVVRHEWNGFADGRTAALEAARESGAEWTLMLDADQVLEDVHGDLRGWLAADVEPDVAAWRVLIRESTLSYRMPRLTRNRVPWRYEGATHEYLVGDWPQRSLLGLTIRHHADGAHRADKHERDLRLLAPGVEAGDPRSVYYTAQALHCLGRIRDAIEMYRRRANMAGTWEEERWHAGYQAALLARDPEGLVAAYRERPWRHEPLAAAADIVRQAGHDDVLFIEGEI